MDLNNYTHPYIDNSIDNIKFTYKFTSETRTGLRIEVITPDPSKYKNTVEIFALEEVYNSHINELADLLKTKQYFSDKYLNTLSSNILNGLISSKKELYRLVFGVEYDKEDFIKRPLSKFKSDILKELGIIWTIFASNINIIYTIWMLMCNYPEIPDSSIRKPKRSNYSEFPNSSTGWRKKSELHTNMAF